jgi:DNA polymerase elongation subunit (family B)
MTRLLVNNAEQRQPDHVDGTHIELFGRAPEDPEQRLRVTVTGFRPYFYAREDAVREQEDRLLAQESVAEVEYGDFESLSGDDLTKIYPPKPQDTRDARTHFEETWAADVPFTNRFRIDTGLCAYCEVPDGAFDGDHATIHYRELTPLVPPSSED